jgi:DNA-binding SARP family transcriptional activator
MPLRIFIVGTVMVSAERTLVEADLHGPQGRLVFAMLAAEHRRPVGRDELAEELWPEAVPAAWDTAIRVLVSRIRASLRSVATAPPELIESTIGGYQFRLPSDGWIDLDEASAAMHRAEAELGAGLIETAGASALVASMIATRPFLPGADGPWATSTRARIRDIRLRALECLAEVWLAKGDYGQASRDAEAILRLDPYREPAHRLLMRTYAAAGDRASAARAYRACRELLAADLGVRPAAETDDLASQLGLQSGPGIPGRRDEGSITSG